MRDFVKAANTDLPGACKVVAENAQDLASEFRLSKSLPAVYRALMVTQ